MQNWQQVRRELGSTPLADGVVGGSTRGMSALYVEHYVFQNIERTVSGMSRAALVTQFGGARVREGENGAWRSSTLPSQSLLVPANCPTHWHYAGTVDFAVFYFPDRTDGITERLRLLAAKAREPIPFGDALVSALAHQLVNELHKGRRGDERFMSLLAPLMLEQIYRVLTTPETGGFNPRHIHFNRLQSVLAHIRDHLGEDLSVATLAALAGVSITHFRRLFQEAMGTPPHRYVLATRLEEARKLLATTQLPIARIADECGFSSQSHFTACFGTAHASTPAEYRNQLQPQTASVGHHKRD
ncbi:MAG: helix-turn-helix domain-containing protein [Halioglobus sp.]|nr:helix-turn-helix domain-containing protein [Halioglobus sp.]